MNVRLFKPGAPGSERDAAALDGLLDGNPSGYIHLGLDRTIVLDGGDGRVTGCLLWRPTAWVHALVLPPVLGIGSAAARLIFDDAARLDLTRKHRPSQVAFTVDNSNLPMLRYVREVLRASEQSSVTTFLLDISAPERKP